MTNPRLLPTPLKVPGYRSIDSDTFVTHFEGANNYSLVFMEVLGGPLLSSRSLLYFELQLPHFIRISKSRLINPAYIQAIGRPSSRALTITLRDGTCLPVARRRSLATLLRMETYWQEANLPEQSPQGGHANIG